MSEHQRKAWWGYIVSAPFKALGAVMSLFSGDEEESEGLNPYHLTKDQEEVVKALQERVSVSVDKKTLVITASVQMQDPVISAQMTKVVLENLQNYITNYRTQKVKQDLEFTQKASHVTLIIKRNVRTLLSRMPTVILSLPATVRSRNV